MSQKNERERFAANRQFYDCWNSKAKTIVHEGGTGSSKTYSILQYIIFLCLLSKEELYNHLKPMLDEGQEYWPLKISIIRKFLPALKRSSYWDFIQILRKWGHYDEKNHNKSNDNLGYNLNGHYIEFFAVGHDDAEKLRSMRRDILYINEGLELEQEEWRQLAVRTNIRSIIDYNPSDPHHFFYDVADAEDSDYFVSTFQDNPFLPKAAREEILKTKQTNPDFWRVYGEGQRAKVLKGRIFNGWDTVDNLPDGEIFYGLDFGWDPDPTALIKIVKTNDALYVEQLLYKTKIKEDLIIDTLARHPRGPVYCDHNQKQTIEALQRSGINAKEGKKGTGSLLEGIDFLKRIKVFVLKTSEDIWEEYLNYRWRLKRGFDPDDDNAWERVPADRCQDHALDAIRLGYYSHYFVGKEFFVV